MRAEALPTRAYALAWGIFVWALGLRLTLVGLHPLHMDEALYAGFSRRILHGDLLLTGGMNNDKPPLQFYWGALSQLFFGGSDVGVRLLDAALGATQCGLLALMLWPLAGFTGAAIGGLLLASSPLHAAVGSMGLTDGPLTFWALGSVWLAIRGEAGWAGLAWALACASKQTGHLLLPLPFLALVLSPRKGQGSLSRFGMGAALGLGPLWLWSAIFAHPRLGMLFLQSAGQAEVGLHAGALQRVGPWMELAKQGFALPWLFAALSVLGVLLVPVLIWRRREERALGPYLALALAAPFMLALFTVLSMRPYDRYWLPALPFLAGLPALALACIPHDFVRQSCGGLALAAALFLILPGRHLSELTSIGGNDGFPTVAERLKTALPQGGVLSGDAAGLHYLGEWYLGQPWHFFESPDAAGLAQLEAGTQPLYWLSRGPGQSQAGWQTLSAPEGWSLQRWTGTHR